MGVVWLLVGPVPQSRDYRLFAARRKRFNCCVLGTLLVAASQNYNLLQSIGFGFGSGVGYLVAVLVVDEGRRRLRNEYPTYIPRPAQCAEELYRHSLAGNLRAGWRNRIELHMDVKRHP